MQDSAWWGIVLYNINNNSKRLVGFTLKIDKWALLKHKKGEKSWDSASASSSEAAACAHADAGVEEELVIVFWGGMAITAINTGSTA